MSFTHRFTHRFMDEIVKARKKGVNQFVIHGDSIKEELVFNYGLGLQTASHSLAFNLLLENNSQTVLILNRDGLFKCTLNAMEYTRKALENQMEVETALSLLKHTTSVEELMQKNNIDFESAFKSYLVYSITAAIEQSSTPIYVIVESLEWMTSWWRDLSLVEEIQKWRQIIDGNNIHLSVLLLPSINAGLDYLSIHPESQSVICLEMPSREEIEILLNKMTKFGLSHLDMQGCVSILKRNKMYLKEIVYLVANILNEQTPPEDFNLLMALKKELPNSIEERVFYDDIIMDDTIKKSVLLSFESFLSTSRQYSAKGLLMHGEPGTGKTMIAKALANQEGFYFLAPKLADLKGQYLGESAKNVQQLFREARKNSPCVIFIDEIDSFLTRRNARNHDAFQSEMLNQFLTEVDGVNSANDKIYILAATNFIDNVDAAVLSRLDNVYIPLPSAKQREEIFLSLIQANNIFLDESLIEVFVKKTEGFSGREIKKVVQKMSAGHSIDQILDGYRASLIKRYAK